MSRKRNNEPFEHDEDDEIIWVSRSEMKRDAEDMQALGEHLLTQTQAVLDKLPLEPRLIQALEEYHRIKHHSAKRRQRQFIGRLMREGNYEEIAQAVEGLEQEKRERDRRFHQLEGLREQLLEDEVNGMELLALHYPDFDRQHVRQLLRQAQREKEQNKPPASARKLFKYLRQLAEA